MDDARQTIQGTSGQSDSARTSLIDVNYVRSKSPYCPDQTCQSQQSRESPFLVKIRLEEGVTDDTCLNQFSLKRRVWRAAAGGKRPFNIADEIQESPFGPP